MRYLRFSPSDTGKLPQHSPGDCIAVAELVFCKAPDVTDLSTSRTCTDE